MLGFAVLMALSGLGNGIANDAADDSMGSISETTEVELQIQNEQVLTQP